MQDEVPGCFLEVAAGLRALGAGWTCSCSLGSHARAQERPSLPCRMLCAHDGTVPNHSRFPYLQLEGGPEGNRADPTVQDKDGWSALTWAIFMVEQGDLHAVDPAMPQTPVEPKMHGKEHASKKQLLEVINYLCQQAAVQEYIERSDRLLNKTAGEMADEISQQSDEVRLVWIVFLP